MARIVVLTHAHDAFQERRHLLGLCIPDWVAAGHQVSVAAGLDALPDADAVFLHVDLSVLPDAYAETARRYPIVINGAVRDIRKSAFSHLLVRPGDGWTGSVIVKTDLNYGGLPEARLRRIQERDGSVDPELRGCVAMSTPYPVYRDPALVPARVWSDPGYVVERFLPERDARGFWVRHWLFLGDEERCNRNFGGQDPIVKSTSILASWPASVPEEIRAERARLGFDFGKFDFGIHDGKPVLYDVNRTPTVPAVLKGDPVWSDVNLARGLDALLRRG